MKKRLAFIGLFAVLLITFVGTVFAYSTTITGYYFQKNTKKVVDTQTNISTNFCTEIKATQLVNSPKIKTTIKGKTVLGWGGASSRSNTISQLNTAYQLFWTQNQRNRVQVTWQQTNGEANMTANLRIFEGASN